MQVSNARVPLAISEILPGSALDAADAGEGRDGFDLHDELGILVAELTLDTKLDGGAMTSGLVAVVHPIGKDRLGTDCADKVRR